MFSIFAQRTAMVCAGLPTVCIAVSIINKSLAKPAPPSSESHFPTVERSNGGV
ncbi:hypothetical protein MJO28_011755 [Puccinia striiformis f. sp. tritici]|uniref:Uncharacterized protein n=3 Tax=Puccinia striiformis TaxID=27350 RepID=A0A2S4WIL4_9BASI|nr:hypothetical protein MJO28_011755 [Puccinia striiformis f. sp. tritici]KAI7946996.1 hypothetical protein MJO29_011523 [Puccinia striiformis f. sp. tritici]POW04788.1 hypothetical protein PSTT_10148 [Puccinia striiformis]POW21527.1 hypothetical protein PSHT_02297 [Puccinia striiformis]